MFLFRFLFNCSYVKRYSNDFSKYEKRRFCIILKFDFKKLLLSLIPVWEDVTVREPFYLFRENFYPSSNVFFLFTQILWIPVSLVSATMPALTTETAATITSLSVT